MKTESYILVEKQKDGSYTFIFDETGNTIESSKLEVVDKLRIYHQPNYENLLCVAKETFEIIKEDK